MVDPWHTCAVRVMVLGLCMCVGNGRAKKPVCKAPGLGCAVVTIGRVQAQEYQRLWKLTKVAAERARNA